MERPGGLTVRVDARRVSQNSVPEGWDGDLAAVLTSYLFRVFEESAADRVRRVPLSDFAFR